MCVFDMVEGQFFDSTIFIDTPSGAEDEGKSEAR